MDVPWDCVAYTLDQDRRMWIVDMRNAIACVERSPFAKTKIGALEKVIELLKDRGRRCDRFSLSVEKRTIPIALARSCCVALMRQVVEQEREKKRDGGVREAKENDRKEEDESVVGRASLTKAQELSLLSFIGILGNVSTTLKSKAGGTGMASAIRAFVSWILHRLESGSVRWSEKSLLADALIALTSSVVFANEEDGAGKRDHDDDDSVARELCDQNGWYRMLKLLRAADEAEGIRTPIEGTVSSSSSNAASFLRRTSERNAKELALVAIANVLAFASQFMGRHAGYISRCVGKSGNAFLEKILTLSAAEKRREIWSLIGVVRYTMTKSKSSTSRETLSKEARVRMLRLNTEMWTGFCDCDAGLFRGGASTDDDSDGI
eukprot:g3627.t1